MEQSNVKSMVEDIELANPSKKKRGRCNSLGLIDKSDNAILQAINALDAKLSLKMDQMYSLIDKKINDVKVDLDRQMIQLSTSVDNRLVDKASIATVAAIEEKLAVVNESVAKHEDRIDKIERELLLDRLVISGIPFTVNENLLDIIKLIGNAIDFNDDLQSVSVFRINSKNQKNAEKSTNYSSIILKFCNVNQRFAFINQYFKKKDLNLKDVGFSTATRIYINDFLTKKNQAIFASAMKLKKAGSIVKTFSYRGIVQVKTADGKISSIFHLDGLNRLIPAAATCSKITDGEN